MLKLSLYHTRQLFLYMQNTRYLYLQVEEEFWEREKIRFHRPHPFNILAGLRAQSCSVPANNFIISSRGGLVVERLLHKKHHSATVDRIPLEDVYMVLAVNIVNSLYGPAVYIL